MSYEQEEGGSCEPAASLIRRLGGPREVSRVIRAHSITADGDRRARQLNPSTVSRWTQSVERGGTGGTIPVKYWPALIKAARQCGHELTIADLSMRIAQAFEQARQREVSDEDQCAV